MTNGNGDEEEQDVVGIPANVCVQQRLVTAEITSRCPIDSRVPPRGSLEPRPSESTSGKVHVLQLVTCMKGHDYQSRHRTLEDTVKHSGSVGGSKCCPQYNRSLWEFQQTARDKLRGKTYEGQLPQPLVTKGEQWDDGEYYYIKYYIYYLYCRQIDDECDWDKYGTTCDETDIVKGGKEPRGRCVCDRTKKFAAYTNVPFWNDLGLYLWLYELQKYENSLKPPVDLTGDVPVPGDPSFEERDGDMGQWNPTGRLTLAIQDIADSVCGVYTGIEPAGYKWGSDPDGKPTKVQKRKDCCVFRSNTSIKPSDLSPPEPPTPQLPQFPGTPRRY